MSTNTRKHMQLNSHPYRLTSRELKYPSYKKIVEISIYFIRDYPLSYPFVSMTNFMCDIHGYKCFCQYIYILYLRVCKFAYVKKLKKISLH